jgi:hypothetical protein
MNTQITTASRRRKLRLAWVVIVFGCVVMDEVRCR